MKIFKKMNSRVLKETITLITFIRVCQSRRNNNICQYKNWQLVTAFKLRMQSRINQIKQNR